MRVTAHADSSTYAVAKIGSPVCKSQAVSHWESWLLVRDYPLAGILHQIFISFDVRQSVAVLLADNIAAL